MTGPPIRIGCVAGLWRYPVKSMRGEQVDCAELRWTGFAGDRGLAFVRTRNRSRFPWMTGRQAADMLLYRAAFARPGDPRDAPVIVTAPDGGAHDIWDDALAQRLSVSAGETVHPMRLGRGAYDQHPISLVAASALVDLDRAAGAAVDSRRFRFNIVIKDEPGAPPQSAWLGGTLAFGDDASGPAIRVDAPIARCAMITIDPDRGVRDPTLARLVASEFENRFGLYATPVRPGFLETGAAVRWTPN